MTRHPLGPLLALLLLTGLAQGQPDGKGTVVKPNREWTGIGKDEKLLKGRPRTGVITDAKALEAIWKDWGVEGKVPAIDFGKEFVIVSTAGGPNRPRVSARLDEKGNLRVTAIATLIGGPGFGYSIAAFSRKGVTTVNGKPLPR
jgi:hypothetical protein